MWMEGQIESNKFIYSVDCHKHCLKGARLILNTLNAKGKKPWEVQGQKRNLPQVSLVEQVIKRLSLKCDAPV